MTQKNFAMTGVAGFVAARHLKAIHDTGHRLVAAVDPHDAVGILDRYAFDVRFFTEFERFDRHLEKLKRGREEDRVHYLSVCSPNYLHDSHMRLALRVGADVICEKPLVINPWNLDGLQQLEDETGRRVYTVLQLRLHPALLEFKERLRQEGGKRHRVQLAYLTARGRWYDVSWKGVEERSGGIVTNIGIHFFDLLVWLFGDVQSSAVNLREFKRAAGTMTLRNADVEWYLSAEASDLPFEPQPGTKTTFRAITVDGRQLEFSEGFTDLHTRVYQEVFAGRGFGIADARPSIELSHQIRHAPITDAAPAEQLRARVMPPK
ncbi:MAG TPA: Gfo/Idh/MocA family oxidoreductase [Vicinamibacterales bacterium]|jgi:UDP-N-acetyl-2-amino-2-deoxyglucuronate dehydrogenase